MKHLIFIFALASGGTFLMAQPAAKPTSKDTFRILSSAPNPIMGLRYDLNGKPIIVNAFTSDISRVYKLPPGQTVEFYTPGPPLPDDPEHKPTKKIVAQASVTGLEGPLLIILAPAPKNSPLPFTSTCRNISLESQPNETALFTNYSTFRVAANFNGEGFSLQPRQTKLISFAGVDGKTGLALAIFKENHWDTIGETLAPVEKDTRTMVFFFNTSTPDGQLAGVNCVIVKDGSPPPEEKKPDATP